MVDKVPEGEARWMLLFAITALNTLNKIVKLNILLVKIVACKTWFPVIQPSYMLLPQPLCTKLSFYATGM